MMGTTGNNSRSSTLGVLYTGKIHRDTQKENEKINTLVAEVLNSEYNTVFQNELETFFKNINVTEDEIPTKDVCQHMFVKAQMGRNRSTSIDGVLRLLSRRLQKINGSDTTENEKIDAFCEHIIGKENMYLLEEYIKENQTDALKSTKDWYNFLHNAGKKLVVPVIAGGMGGTGIFKFLTQGGIESINHEHIMRTPGMDNIIQAIITIGVLLLIKKVLKVKIQHNS